MGTIALIQRGSTSYERRWLRRATAIGNLVDWTSLARADGTDAQLYISRRLFSSLVREFPSARPCDYVSAQRMVQWVGDAVIWQPPRRQELFLLRPPGMPYWVNDFYVLKVRRIYSRRRIWAIVLMTQDEAFHFLPKKSTPSLPCTLLMRLALALQSLMAVGRACDAPSLDHMHAVVSRLIGMSPFQCDIHAFLKRKATGIPAEFTRREYRSLVLKTLHQLVRLAEVAAEDEGVTRLVQSFRWRLGVVSSRLTEMTFVVEEMLRLASHVRWRVDDASPTPFECLLAAYVTMQKALTAGQTALPTGVLSHVRQQLYCLQGMLDEQQLDCLFDLNARFKCLGGDARQNGIVCLASEETHVVQ